MSERVPEGWVATKLGALGSFSKGKGISKSETISKGIPCLRYAEIYTNYDFVIKNFKSFIEPDTIKTSKKLVKNDIIFAGSGETVEDIGKSVAFISDHEAYVGGDSIILSPSPDLNSIFLSYQLNDEIRRKQLRKLGQGSSVIHIYSSGLAEINLVLPPLPEQKKIASILTSVDEVIETTQKQIDKLQDLKKATMNELLTKGIGHTEFKDSELGRIPKSWEVNRLDQISIISRGKFSHRPRNDPNFYDGKYPYLQTGDIPTDDTDITSFNQTLNDRGLTVSKLFPKGTLVLTIAATIGEVGMLTFESCFPDSLVGIGCKKNKASTYFLLYALRSAKQKLIAEAPESAQKNLNLEILNPFPIAVPSLTEQKEIENILLSIDDNLKEKSQKLAQTQSLKKSLMQDLLTGKVRVKVN